MNLGYVRVSSELQNIESQINIFDGYVIDRWYTETTSSINDERSELVKMIENSHIGDAIYVSDISRISRNAHEIMKYYEDIKNKGVRLVSIQDGIDTFNDYGEKAIDIIYIINDVELYSVFDRQKEGIEIAKVNGTYKGGKQKQIDEKLFNDNLVKFKKGLITKCKFAENIGVSRPTLDRILNLKR